MNYRTLGNSAIKVSEIGMGCEGFEGKSQAETNEMVDYALSKGINFIEIYSSNPELRERLGNAFARHPRSSFAVQGHIGSVWKDGQYSRSRNLGECKAAFEDFMRLMQLDYVDIACIHYCDDQKDFQKIFGGCIIEYARDLKAAGKIGAIGISTHNPAIARRAAETGLIDVILFSINPAYDTVPANEDIDVLFDKSTYDRPYAGIDPDREELYHLCRSLNVSIIVMKGYAGGLLLDGSESPFGKAMTPVQCIHYCLNRPAVASVMVGAHSKEEFAHAAHYCEASDEEKDYADVITKAPGSSFNGHCMYCGHCAPCPVKIDIAALNKLLDLTLVQGFVPETVRGHYLALEHHAGECIACGKCESNCPFGVDIIGKMKKAAKVFGQ